MAEDQPKSLDDAVREAGFDTARIWCNSARVLNGPNELILVFQEKIGIEGSGQSLERNLTSIVIPKAIAKELANIMLNQPGVGSEA